MIERNSMSTPFLPGRVCFFSAVFSKRIKIIVNPPRPAARLPEKKPGHQREHRSITGVILLWTLLLTMSTGFFVPLSAAGEEPFSGVRRFAMIIGANNGGKERVKLRYAVSDALTIGRILKELGGVAPEDVLLLADPDVETVFSETKKLQARMQDARARQRRIEIVFYYSGHSDEKQLLLNEETIPYEQLRETIKGMPADVRIAILDSCASGAFTRIKGGRKMPAFLLDEAYDMTGYAFLTSSSATEVSQESDLLRSSFFTHYLASGLRGAADLNGDGRVTLNEAYQFAFNETLAETTRTVHGPQHPNYDIGMSGTGDVVLTDIRAATAVLVLGEEISGRIFIHDQSGRLMLETTKPGGRTITLALEEAAYRIVRISNGRVHEAGITLKKGRQDTLSARSFSLSAKKYTTPRGDRALRIREETGALIFGGRPLTVNLAQPTGAVLNRGQVLLGIGPVAFGLADGVQFGTNIFNVISGVYNADVKAALVRPGPVRIAAGLNWSSLKLTASGKKESFSSLSPYLAASARISARTTLHLGARYTRFFGETDIKKTEYDAKADGSTVYSGLDLDISEKTKFLVEFGYDMTFQALRSGAGFLFAGRSIRCKLGFQYFQQQNNKGFTRSIIQIWWRL